ncbi:MAG TPA: hypothetical protein VIL55_16695 [Naasia sp.]|jgi:stage V sporulation protein SpoVS
MATTRTITQLATPSEIAAALAELAQIRDEIETLIEGAGSAGKSAYEIAVDNGFVGTEADFAAQLTRPAPAFSGTSATSLAIANTSTRTFVTQAGIMFSIGQYVRAAATASTGTYMAGTVTAYSGTSLTIAVEESAGSGTFAAWALTPAAPRGTAGSPPSFTASSTTSRLITDDGDVAFTVPAGLTFAPGQYLRVSSTGSPLNYMAGVVKTYSGTTLTITILESGGSGTFAAWSIALSGAPGAQGEPGHFDYNLYGNEPKLKFNGTSWPARAAKLAAINAAQAAGGYAPYTGEFIYDSLRYNSAVPAPTDAVAGDRWRRRAQA